VKKLGSYHSTEDGKTIVKEDTGKSNESNKRRQIKQTNRKSLGYFTIFSIKNHEELEDNINTEENWPPKKA
jgi:hypothetical protein